MPYVGFKLAIVWPKLATWQLLNSLHFRVTFIYLLSLFKRLLCRLKVLSLIIFITIISLRLILVLCFFSWFALLKLGCILYTRASNMPSNTVYHGTHCGSNSLLSNNVQDQFAKRHTMMTTMWLSFSLSISISVCLSLSFSLSLLSLYIYIYKYIN